MHQFERRYWLTLVGCAAVTEACLAGFGQRAAWRLFLIPFGSAVAGLLGSWLTRYRFFASVSCLLLLNGVGIAAVHVCTAMLAVSAGRHQKFGDDVGSIFKVSLILAFASVCLGSLILGFLSLVCRLLQIVSAIGAKKNEWIASR